MCRCNHTLIKSLQPKSTDTHFVKRLLLIENNNNDRFCEYLPVSSENSTTVPSVRNNKLVLDIQMGCGNIKLIYFDRTIRLSVALKHFLNFD